jgi:hypothetical protein
MDEVTGLQQLSIPLLSLETTASTQKALADEASPRDPPRCSLNHPHSQIRETAYSKRQACLRVSGVHRYSLLEAWQKNLGRARLMSYLTILFPLV